MFIIKYSSQKIEHPSKITFSWISFLLAYTSIPLYFFLYTISSEDSPCSIPPFLKVTRKNWAFALIFEAFCTCKLQKSAMSNHPVLLSLCLLFVHMTSICPFQFVCLLCVPFFSQVTSISHSHFLPISNKVYSDFSAQPWSAIESSLHLSVSSCYTRIAFHRTLPHILLSFMS